MIIEYSPIVFFPLGEAIEKMLQEKKISTKINYEVLKSLNNQQRNNQELHSTNIKSRSDDPTNFNKPSVHIVQL